MRGLGRAGRQAGTGRDGARTAGRGAGAWTSALGETQGPELEKAQL